MYFLINVGECEKRGIEETSAIALLCGHFVLYTHKHKKITIQEILINCESQQTTFCHPKLETRTEMQPACALFWFDTVVIVLRRRQITVQRFEVSFASVDQLPSARIEFIQYILQQREITQSVE